MATCVSNEVDCFSYENNKRTRPLLFYCIALSSSSWNLIKIKNSFHFLSPSEWADWSEWHAYDGNFIVYTIAHWLICYWTNIIKSTSQLIETDSKSIDLSFVLEVMKRIFCVHRSFHQSLVHWLDRIVNMGWCRCINCFFDYRQSNHWFTNQ